MKFNISFIIRDHFLTLYDVRNKSTSMVDVSLFYILPAALGLLAYLRGVNLESEAYNLSIVIFGIFIALLLNIQVAIFSVLHSKWEEPSDQKMIERYQLERNDKAQLLRELNTNLSYMILLSSLVLFVSALEFVLRLVPTITSAFLIFAFTHFVLSLLMVIKRAHALFHKEYS